MLASEPFIRAANEFGAVQGLLTIASRSHLGRSRRCVLEGPGDWAPRIVPRSWPSPLVVSGRTGRGPATLEDRRRVRQRRVCSQPATCRQPATRLLLAKEDRWSTLR